MKVLGKKVVSSDGSMLGRVKDMMLLDNGNAVYIIAEGRKKHYALLPPDIRSIGEVIVADNTYKVNLKSQLEKALFVFSKSEKYEVIGKSGYHLGHLRGFEIDDDELYPKIILKNKSGEMAIPCDMISGEKDHKIIINSE